MTILLGKQSRTLSLDDICQKYNINSKTIPKHVAIIMDGNGRWAKQRKKQRIMGHKEGVKALRRTIQACADLGVHYLSVYAFSTENWKRPSAEVIFLMKLLKNLLDKDLQELHEEGAQIKCIGDPSRLDKGLRDRIKKAEELTKNNTVIRFNIMINYGSRDEIINAVKSISEKVKTGEIQEITESTINDHLMTYDCPDPDILIRTSGEYRISNYMLWQISYSELFFIDTLWPDFNEESLGSVISSYQNRDRRYGGLKT